MQQKGGNPMGRGQDLHLRSCNFVDQPVDVKTCIVLKFAVSFSAVLGVFLLVTVASD